jgi:hypothetical protein
MAQLASLPSSPWAPRGLAAPTPHARRARGGWSRRRLPPAGPTRQPPLPQTPLSPPAHDLLSLAQLTYPCPSAALAPSPRCELPLPSPLPSPSPSLARRGLPPSPSRSRGPSNSPRRRGFPRPRSGSPSPWRARPPPPRPWRACPDPSPACARPRTAVLGHGAPYPGARPRPRPRHAPLPRPGVLVGVARRAPLPRPSMLVGVARRAPLPPSRRAALSLRALVPWRAHPVPARPPLPARPRRRGPAAHPSQRVPGAARPSFGAVSPQRGPAACSRRLSQHVRSSAPACAWLVRGVSARPCPRACSRGARGALARLVVPSAQRVTSCRGWRACLPLDVLVYL